MFSLTERNCADLKDEVLEGRLTVGGMWGFLVCSFLISSIVIGVAYMAATANTVGWGTLSGRWHMFFYIEVIIFALHLLVLLSCWANNPFSQKVASIAVVVCSYRIAFEPYTVVLLVSKDRGTYDLYLPVVQVIIVCALVFHIIVFRRWVKEMKKMNQVQGFSKIYIY